LSELHLVSNEPYDFKEAFRKTIDEVDIYCNNRGVLGGIDTGFELLTQHLDGLQPGLILFAGSANSGKCIRENSLIIDPDTGELKTIKEIYEEDKEETLTLEADYKITKTKIQHKVYDGIRPVYKVTTETGKIIEGTAIHPLLTIHGWKQIQQLKKAEHIATPRIINVFGKNKIDDYKIKLLAYLISDGGLTGTSPKFFNPNSKIIEEIKEAALNFPDIEVKVNKKSNENCYDITFPRIIGSQKSNSLTNWLKEIGLHGKSSHEKNIPKMIFTSPKENVRLFLNRIFACDGSACISGDRATIEYSSVNKKIIDDLQHLLLRFGILSRQRLKMVKYKETRRPAYILTVFGDKENINKFSNEIGIFSKEEALQKCVDLVNARSDRTTGRSTDRIPYDIIKVINRKSLDKGITWEEIGNSFGNLKRPKSISSIKGNMKRQRLKEYANAIDDEELRNLATSDIFWDKIKSIEYVGEHPVYDLTIENTHNFVANDVIVHNTAVMTQIAIQAASVNDNVFCLYHSLDDNVKEIIPRFVANLEQIAINSVKFPERYKTYPGGELLMERRKAGIERLKNLSDKILIRDSLYGNNGSDIEVIESSVKQVREGIPDDFELVLFIDNFHDITCKEYNTGDEKAKYDFLADKLSALATKYSMPICCSAEFRKLNGFKRPTVDDVREFLFFYIMALYKSL